MHVHTPPEAAAGVFSGGIQDIAPSIQFDTKGVEFGPWIRRFVAQIKRNWFIPQAAMTFRGRVVVQFNIHKDGRIFIKALRNIRAGEELNYDYGLIIDERYTKKLKAEYPCWCGSANCRGTLLAPKRGWAPPMPGDQPAPAPGPSKKTRKAQQAKGRPR